MFKFDHSITRREMTPNNHLPICSLLPSAQQDSFWPPQSGAKRSNKLLTAIQPPCLVLFRLAAATTSDSAD
jgi:hypothetical protein